MKIIFLDIDGVMNSGLHTQELYSAYTRGELTKREYYDTFDMPYKETLEALKYIIDNTGAQVVLSSTWRLNPENIVKLNKCFEPYGFSIIDRTCSGVYLTDIEKLGFNTKKCYSVYFTKNDLKYSTDRGAEIAMWLSKHSNIESFVILDDDSADIKQYYPKNFVQTDFYGDALNMECAEKAIKILNKLK